MPDPVPERYAGSHAVNSSFDVVVVGAGPGGLAAAAAAIEAEQKVCIVDDNPACGGQIWRGSHMQANGTVAHWLERYKGRVTFRLGWRAVVCFSNGSAGMGGTLRVENESGWEDLGFKALILATGARELFLPFPGWTLPGVFGAGGLQAFVKSGLDIRGKRVVVAGTGPLLWAVAAALKKAGAELPAIVEQAPLHRLVRFTATLALGDQKKLYEGARYLATLRGVPFKTGAWIKEVAGNGRMERVSVASGSGSYELKADMLAIGYHLIPNLELPSQLGCAIVDGYVRVDAQQQTSVKGVYCVGEATGIGGLEKAQIEGNIAGLSAAERIADTQPWIARLKSQMRFVKRLSATFALRPELRDVPAADTMVCRCEDVAHEALRGCRSWREAKLHTRCGMGPCQGRICAPAAQFLYGWEAAQVRPPVFPANVSTLASHELEIAGANVSASTDMS